MWPGYGAQFKDDETDQTIDEAGPLPSSMGYKKLERAASWLCSSLSSAFFTTLDLCACIKLQTEDISSENVVLRRRRRRSSSSSSSNCRNCPSNPDKLKASSNKFPSNSIAFGSSPSFDASRPLLMSQNVIFQVTRKRTRPSSSSSSSSFSLSFVNSNSNSNPNPNPNPKRFRFFGTHEYHRHTSS